MTREHVKVWFPLDDDDFENESMWCVPKGGGYAIGNIPFYATSIALNDVVSAVPDEEGRLWVRTESLQCLQQRRRTR